MFDQSIKENILNSSKKYERYKEENNYSKWLMNFWDQKAI